MGKFMIMIVCSSILLAGCGRVEVIASQRCAKVVGKKYYERTLLGAPTGSVEIYLIMSDGRELKNDDYYYLKDPVTDKICMTEWIEKPDLNLKDVPGRPQ